MHYHNFPKYTSWDTISQVPSFHKTKKTSRDRSPLSYPHFLNKINASNTNFARCERQDWIVSPLIHSNGSSKLVMTLNSLDSNSLDHHDSGETRCARQMSYRQNKERDAEALPAKLLLEPFKHLCWQENAYASQGMVQVKKSVSDICPHYQLGLGQSSAYFHGFHFAQAFTPVVQKGRNWPFLHPTMSSLANISHRASCCIQHTYNNKLRYNTIQERRTKPGWKSITRSIDRKLKPWT